MVSQSRFLGLLLVWALVCVNVACADVEDDAVTEKSASLTGSSFTDQNGWTWHKVYDIDEYNDSAVPVQSDEDPEPFPTIGEMTVEDVAKYYRPVMEFDKQVYELSDDDTLALAVEMKNAFEEGIDPIEPSPVLDENSTTTTVAQSMVIGSDDRNWSGSDNDFPHRAVAAGRTRRSTCTASKNVNHHTALTAAHCVHVPGVQEWRTRFSWQFDADSSAARTSLNRGCYSRIVPWGYAITGAHAFDFAVLRFNGEREWCDLSSYNVGHLGGRVFEDEVYRVAGYPDVEGYPNYARDSNTAYEGFLLTNMAFYTADATGGQSGGPVTGYSTSYDDYVYTSSLHKGDVWTPGRGFENWGRKFDGGLMRWFKGAGAPN